MATIPSTLSKPPTTNANVPGEAKTTNQKVVIDLGKQKRSKVRALRNGEGVLMDDVQREIARLRETGVLKKEGPIVLFLVREKTRRALQLW